MVGLSSTGALLEQSTRVNKTYHGNQNSSHPGVLDPTHRKLLHETLQKDSNQTFVKCSENSDSQVLEIRRVPLPSLNGFTP